MNYNGYCISLRGENHVKKDKECQDSSGYICNDSYSCVIVSDGHSSHLRSRVGSTIAVRIALEKVKDYASDFDYFSENIKSNPEKIIKTIERSIYDSWLSEIIHYDAESTYSEKERERGIPDSLYEVLHWYGATLIIGFLTKEYYFGIQIGDGNLVVISDEGEVNKIDELKDKLCSGSTTTSLSDKNADEYFHHFFRINDETDPIRVIVANTDGFTGGSKTGDYESDMLAFISKIGSEKLWYKNGCRNLNNRTMRQDKDDTSLSVCFDTQTQFDYLYNIAFEEEYPYDEDYEFYVKPRARICKYALRGDLFVEEIVEDYSEEEVRLLTLKNGVVEKTEVLEEKKDSIYDYYAVISDTRRRIPLKENRLGMYLTQLFNEFKMRFGDDACLSDILHKMLKLCKVYSIDILNAQSVLNDFLDKNLTISKSYQMLDLPNDFEDVSKLTVAAQTCVDSTDEHLFLPLSDQYTGNVIEYTSLFSGEYKNGQRYKGKLLLKSGEVFDGHFRNNEMYKGKKYLADGKLIYDGEFLNGKYSGNGILYDYEKSRFIIGKFVNGVADGYGEEYYFTREGRIPVGEEREGLLRFSGIFDKWTYSGNNSVFYPDRDERGTCYKGKFKDKIYYGSAGSDNNGIWRHGRIWFKGECTAHVFSTIDKDNKIEFGKGWFFQGDTIKNAGVYRNDYADDNNVVVSTGFEYGYGNDPSTGIAQVYATLKYNGTPYLVFTFNDKPEFFNGFPLGKPIKISAVSDRIKKICKNKTIEECICVNVLGIKGDNYKDTYNQWINSNTVITRDKSGDCKEICGLGIYLRSKEYK